MGEEYDQSVMHLLDNMKQAMTDYRVRAERAERLLIDAEKVCTWSFTPVPGEFVTRCGERYNVYSSPSLEHYRFCPGCGKPILECDPDSYGAPNIFLPSNAPVV